MMANKVQITKINEVRYAKATTVFPDTNRKVVFKTIQITEHDPSNFIMVIKREHANGLDQTEIPLMDYRTRFRYQNGKYILDVSQIDRFQKEGMYHYVSISFRSIEKFENIDIEVYSHMIDFDIPIEHEMMLNQ